jgi:hypothetical protein
VLITCPAVYPLHEVPYDFWRPTPYALERFATRYGLRVVESESAGSGWDVLGTVVGALHVTAGRPGLGTAVLRKVLAATRKLLIRMARSPGIRRRIELRGNMYLSNIVVLAAAEESGTHG